MAQIALRNVSGWNVRRELLYWIAHSVHCIVCCGEFSIALGIWWSSGVQAESSPQHQYRNRAELTMCRGNSRNSHLDLFFIQNRLSQGEGRSKYIFDEEENNENKDIGFTIFNFDPLQIERELCFHSIHTTSLHSHHPFQFPPKQHWLKANVSRGESCDS